MTKRSPDNETMPLFEEVSGAPPDVIEVEGGGEPIALGYVRNAQGEIIDQKSGDMYDENDGLKSEKPSPALVRARQIVAKHYGDASPETQKELVQFYRRQIEAKKGSEGKN
ncbi:MAG: hypothetical protein Q8Q39_05885 [bacterium]|nr:hypothetical protein [bacterium]